ncbi:MAG: hypothetical protein E7643_08190 [Ruminococcaceae bacterium]|nr:hypothetical protein [Oscillospiraceae bacterium]
MNYQLYGDGIHDDYPAIQEMLDAGMQVVYLPVPEKNYVISKTLKIHSRQELRLDAFTRVMLSDGANCEMLTNDDHVNGNDQVRIVGGIWDMNHKNQKPNPYHFPDPDTGMTVFQWMEANNFDREHSKDFPPVWRGFCFTFNDVKRFYLGDITIVNPVVYGISLSYIENFTIENITFEYNEGSPKLWNLDGIHLERHCKNGYIHNLKGACHDDLIALTSDDFMPGPIENIEIDGIFAEGCHSAVRLLSQVTPVKNVSIKNIFGTFYTYCIVISKYKDFGTGAFDNIDISNVYASHCPGTVDVPGNYSPLIQIGPDLTLKRLTLSNIHRNETRCTTPTVGIKDKSYVKYLNVYNAEQTNETGTPIPFIGFMGDEGEIENLTLLDIDTNGDPLLSHPERVKKLSVK